MINNYSILADHIVDEYIKDISGSNIKDKILYDGNLREKIPVGVLSEIITDNMLDGYKENSSFIRVSSIRLSVNVKKTEDATVRIIPRGDLYYNVVPTYDEIVEYFTDYYTKKNGIKKYSSMDEIVEDYPIDRVSLPIAYKKCNIENYINDGFEIQVGKVSDGKKDLTGEFLKKLDQLSSEIKKDICIVNAKNISIMDLKNEEEYRKRLNKSDEKVNPKWNFELITHIKTLNGVANVTVELNNKTTILKDQLKTNIGYLKSLFNSGIDIKGVDNTTFEKIDLKCFEDTYKENVPVYGVARNASSIFDEENNIVRTINVPKFYQKRLKTNNEFNDYTTFDKLIEDPISNLKYILNKMKEDFVKCRKEYDTLHDSLSRKQAEKFSNDLSDYEIEIENFEKGIQQLDDNRVYDAFKYMNMTFNTKLKTDKNTIKGWRLFQIVFIVSMIPEVIRSEYKNLNDLKKSDLDLCTLLYFPTGGGKTEAFLGISVFDMFFDRIRGKEDGISAILKYPLRLLTVQQLDRVLKVILKANIVRENSELKNTNKFQVGFFVGSSNTPNRIRDIGDKSPKELNETYCFIDTCPICGEKSMTVELDSELRQLQHKCTNVNCNTGVLPLLIIDEEIFRYLPSIVVSTVDKMAMLGTTREFKSIFGQFKCRCKKHGYSIMNRCINNTCEIEPVSEGELYDPAPTLFIQDEMHLIRESLGTFDAHYESFINYYMNSLLPENQRKKPCLIGATATISQYGDHIRNLYHAEPVRFPCAYPSVNPNRDFYSYIDENDITRIMIGYIPFDRIPVTGAAECISDMRKIVYDMMNSDFDNTYNLLIEKGFTASKEEFKEMLYDYWISIVYNNRKNDVDTLENIIQNQQNDKLNKAGIVKHSIESMTSDVDFQKVRKTLFDINDNRRKLDATNTILATSTISHGVDEDSFNIISFLGMPNNNAEYVQAYSRTGRKYTGIVVDIIRMSRVRDRSYLKNFKEFHENKDFMIEPVPINRWARNAIFSTIPGLFAGLIYQYYSNSYDNIYVPSKLKKAFESDEIKQDDIINHLINIYGCNVSDKLSLSYEEIIRNVIADLYTKIASNVYGEDDFLSDVIGRYTPMHKKPMTSLHDTEETILIQEGDYYGNRYEKKY